MSASFAFCSFLIASYASFLHLIPEFRYLTITRTLFHFHWVYLEFKSLAKHRLVRPVPFAFITRFDTTRNAAKTSKPWRAVTIFSFNSNTKFCTPWAFACASIYSVFPLIIYNIMFFEVRLMGFVCHNISLRNIFEPVEILIIRFLLPILQKRLCSVIPTFQATMRSI